MSTDTNQGIDIDATTSSDIDNSRRRLFGKGAAIAAVAAVAGVAASSSKIHAANGGTFVIGAANTGTLTTTLQGGSSLRVNDGVSTNGGLASVYGVQNSTLGTYGVRGDASIFGGVGVYGLASSTAGGTGVRGDGTSYDFVAGSSGRVFVKPNGGVAFNSGGSAGTIAADSAGALWYCHTNNKWLRVSAAGTAGAFTPINPVRVFDSRNAGFPTPGVFAAGSSRAVSVKDGRNQTTGAVTLADAVPNGATAVTFNVTATNTAGGNFLAVAPGDAASTDVSTVNWSAAGVSIANASVVKLDATRQLKIFAGPGGSFDAIVDITGYYL